MARIHTDGNGRELFTEDREGNEGSKPLGHELHQLARTELPQSAQSFQPRMSGENGWKAEGLVKPPADFLAGEKMAETKRLNRNHDLQPACDMGQQLSRKPPESLSGAKFRGRN